MRKLITVTIASGATSSGWRNVEDTDSDNGAYAICGIATPGNVDSTTVQVDYSIDGSTALAITDTTGTAKTLTQAANKYIILAPADYPVVPKYFRLTLGSAAAAARTYTVVLKSVD